ncbi:MAG: zinc ribbon domain-containing protein [Acidobacteriota bacterium]
MPIYDYKCLDCNETFEALILKNSPQTVCPGCQSTKLEQLISMFKVDSAGTRELSSVSIKKKNADTRKEYNAAQIAHEREHSH